jgi:serine/threonine protein kinase
VGDPDSPALSKLPDRFGNYSILGHIATGGMAEVYLARQTGLEGFEKTVVIKRVRPELMSDRDVTGSFLDEARLVATLQHPNIAQVYEIGLVNQTYFLVMEYVHGADLRQLMDRAGELGQRVTIADAIYILIQACVALHYAHEKRGSDGQRLDIIHRDVTPSNVLLSHDGAVKVCDFGIAKATNRTTETVRGALKGKYAYMSPEQCKCTQLDRRSDIFTLGILLYELSTLTRPFSADSDFELLRAIIETPATPPSTRVRHYPRDLERIVLRALTKDPDARYPTAQAMQLDLEAFAREYRFALSSVNIARLMAELFNDRVDALLRARREAEAADDPLGDTAAHTAENLSSMRPRAAPSAADPIDTQPEIAALATNPLGERAPDTRRDERPRTIPATPSAALRPQSLVPATPNTPKPPVVAASRSSASTHAPLAALSPNAPTQALAPSPPNAPIPAPLPSSASTPNAPTQMPLTASTPIAPTQMPLTASMPGSPLQASPRLPAVAGPLPLGATSFPVGTHFEAAPRAPRRPSALWLLGVFAAGLFATGVSLAGQLIDRAADAATASALDADAERLASALDVGMRSARLRATGIAATPVLRAAIETDAATMKDLAEKEYAFSVAAGETLEIFQARKGKTTSLLRLPDTDPRLEPLADTAARVQAIGNHVTVIAGAPITTNAGVRGSLAVATRVDLAPATRQLAQHAVEASLRGRGLDFHLVDSQGAPRGTPRTIALPTTSELAGSELALIATPITTTTTWVAPARLAGIAAAALLLACYLITFWRIRTAAHRA